VLYFSIFVSDIVSLLVTILLVVCFLNLPATFLVNRDIH